MRLHFGYKIGLVYGLFVLFLITMVYRSTIQKFDLVAPDYYDQELKYQQVIDAKANTEKLTTRLQMETIEEGLVVRLPITTEVKEGRLHLYKPDNAEADVKISFESAQAIVPRHRLQKGKYLIKVYWKSANSYYYAEDVIFM